jgi:hypothetical protein
MPLIASAASRCSCIRYLGNLPKDDLLPVYLAADAGIVTHAAKPLLATALSAKLFDYIAADMVVICLAKGITGELLTFSGGGIALDSPGVPELEKAVLEAYAMSPRKMESDAYCARNWMLEHINAVAMGDTAARIAMNTRPPASRTALLRKALKAMTLGFADVVSGRSDAILRDFRVRDAAEWSRRLWRDWLDSREHDDARLPLCPNLVPDILSGVRRHGSPSFESSSPSDARHSTEELAPCRKTG